MVRLRSSIVLAVGAVILLSVSSVFTQPTLPVIPGAPLSPGMSTRAAYGGGSSPTVYRVTSLADDGGTGTLRYALEASAPRVVIFETSGTIVLTSDIYISTPYVTVAGQTAPSPGITVRNYGIQIRTHDVHLQHFRIRPGWIDHCTDALGTYPAASNVVIDHMSLSWGQDENFYVYPGLSGGPANVTFWRSITAENLSYPGTTSAALCNPSNPAGEPGHGFLVTQLVTGVAMIQSVSAHNEQRNPLIQNGSTMVMVNNVIFDWYKEWGFAAESRDTLPPGAWHATVVGNRFVRGPNTVNAADGNIAWMFSYLSDGSQAGNTIYRTDNTLANDDGHVVEEYNANAVSGVAYDPNVPSPPSQAPLPSGYTVLASTDVENFVLPRVGARPVDRDTVDTRIIAEITARTGLHPANQSDVGGWPTLAANTWSLSVPASPNADSGNGYTNLEVWLQGYAAAAEGTGSSGPVDVSAAAGSVVISAAFTGSAGVPLVSYLSDIGGSWARHPGSTGTLALSSANRLLNTSVDVGATAVTSLTLSSASTLTTQYDVEWDWRVVTLIPGNVYSIWARVVPPVSGTALTGYYGVYSATTGTLTLGKAVNDVYTALGACALTLANNTTYHGTLRMRDASKHLVLAGTQCASTTDNTIAGAGKIGISSHATTTADTGVSGVHVDNLVVTDVTSSSTTITTASLPAGVLTQAYSTTLSASGGTAPYTWAIITGALPTGLSLNTSTGAITGTPSDAGASFTVRVTDNVAATATKALTIVVLPAASIVTASPLPSGERNSLYSVTLAGNGDQTPYAWAITSGTLPTGLVLSAATGVITGTPTVATSGSFTVRLTGALGSTTTKSLTFAVLEEYRPPQRPVSRNAAEGVLFRRGTAPSNPFDRVMRADLWVNTSVSPPQLNVCVSASATTAVWAPVQ